MATPAAFSRLQLAAALLEYDNDPDNPDAPYKSAQDSAIFAHLRRNPAARPDIASRKSDYLGVSIPSEGGSIGGRESALDTRRSRGSKASIDALHNPFGADINSNENSDAGDDDDKDGDGEEGLEVDLASWGLDAFIPKDKKSAKGKGKQASVPAVNATRSRLLSNSNLPPDPNALTPARRGLITSKSVSLGGDIEANHAIRPEMDRRKSFGSPLDLVGMEPSGEPIHPPPRQRERAQSHASLRGGGGGGAGIPFPTAPSVRSPSPGPDQAYANDSVSRRPGNARTHSMASMNSRMLLEESERNARDDAASQLFPDTASRYTPAPVEDNPFAIQHTTHTSRFDPKNAAAATTSRARSHSNATLGSRFPPDLAGDSASMYTTGDPYARERRYSTLELLRPKVLVMPSPLQQAAPPPPPEPKFIPRDGFEISTDGPPLPPGARTSRRLSSSMSFLEAAAATGAGAGAGGDPGLVASNSFTPNPLASLTLSQKTFRNTLAVPGMGALPYVDGTRELPRATEDGEQAVLDAGDAAAAGARPESMVLPAGGLPGLVDPNSKTSRPAGKLFGKSLIDDLEERKATMRSKQRVFTGDQRPSMMARESTRSSTLIDPATLANKPEALGAGLSRHPSVTLKPLISFDSDEKNLTAPPPPNARLPSSRSVFGVDTLWQREMEKLKEMERQEAEEREAARVREEGEERRRKEKKAKRKKIRKKGRGEQGAQQQEEQEGGQEGGLQPDLDGEGEDDGLGIPRVSAEPPTLPDIRRASKKPPPKPSDSDVSSESDDDEEAPPPARQTDAGWHSSDEEDTGPRRTTGVGPRYPARNTTIPTHVPMPLPTEDSDEEDLPLAAAIEKVRQRHTTFLRPGDDDSEDEDKPLSRILQEKTMGSSASVHNLRPPASHLRPRASGNDDEDDDEPLALRASRIPPALAGADEDEDEVPLAFHPEQQRRTQYAMLQQHQHQQHQQQMAMAQAQQQQMMMQNMLMNPAAAGMMSPGYFNPAMMNPMAMMHPMQPPMPMPSPPPMHDPAKHSLVDRWRREVEG